LEEISSGKGADAVHANAQGELSQLEGPMSRREGSPDLLVDVPSPDSLLASSLAPGGGYGGGGDLPLGGEDLPLGGGGGLSLGPMHDIFNLDGGPLLGAGEFGHTRSVL